MALTLYMYKIELRMQICLGNLRMACNRAQITFGAIAKGNLLPFEMCLKKQADFL